LELAIPLLPALPHCWPYMVPDAHLATVLSQDGVVVMLDTHNRDFRKFATLDVRDPLV